MTDMKYGEASLNAREHFSNKVKTQLNKGATDYGMRFVKLTSVIPNWETYLTAKQKEAAIKYLKTMNAYEVDHQLRLSNGTTHQRLFGSKTARGAIGRLQDVYKLLEENGHFTIKQKRQEAVEVEKKKHRLTEKTLNQMKELFKLIHSVPNYETHITKSQQQKVDELIKTRSLLRGAQACGVTVETFEQSLLGKNGVLGKLKDVNQLRMVNSWDEVR